MGPSELLIVVMILAFPAIWLGTLVDALVRPSSQWAAADREKAVWVVRLVLLGWVAGLVYLASVRPRLVEAARTHPPEKAKGPQPPQRRSEWGDPWQD